MSRATRTFVALPIPQERAEKLARLQSLIAPELPTARWVEPEKFHLTLAFLGDVPDADLTLLCRTVADAVLSFPPFELSLEGLGVFPDPTRPRVVWAGVTGSDLEQLSVTQKAVAAAVASVGYPLEDDRFSPHITLGRLKPGARAVGRLLPPASPLRALAGRRLRGPRSDHIRVGLRQRGAGIHAAGTCSVAGPPLVLYGNRGRIPSSDKSSLRIEPCGKFLP